MPQKIQLSYQNAVNSTAAVQQNQMRPKTPTPQQATGAIQRKTNQKPAKQTKEKKKGPIQAKQRPLQRATTSSKPKGNAQFQQIAAAMGEQHGVDTSPLQATHNSPFPEQVNAEATIQGNKINFAPGKDTEHHMKHEVGHYIDNAKNGVPKGDQEVNGQKVDTTREQVVDKMANEPLQQKSAGEGVSNNVSSFSSSSGSHSSNPIQRISSKDLDREIEYVLEQAGLSIYFDQIKGHVVRRAKKQGINPASSSVTWSDMVPFVQKVMGDVNKGKIKLRQGNYRIGQHGAKKKEQQRLTRKHGVKVTGDTAESEHVVGFNVFNRNSGEKRGGGKDAVGREDQAPAYQEVKADHRKHVGTGSGKQVDNTGFSADTYRDAQEETLKEGRVGNSYQLNQLGYGHLYREKEAGVGVQLRKLKFIEQKQGLEPGTLRKALVEETVDKIQADDSYEKMVMENPKIPYVDENKQVHELNLSMQEQAEALIARYMATTGLERHEIEDYEINIILNRNGLPLLDDTAWSQFR